MHDAFIKAFGRLSDLADPAAFRSWLGSIVVFAVRSRLRRLRLMNMLGLGRGADPIDLDSLASPDTSPHTRAQLAQIYALLMTRPLDDRIAWTLRHVEGHELTCHGQAAHPPRSSLPGGTLCENACAGSALSGVYGSWRLSGASRPPARQALRASRGELDLLDDRPRLRRSHSHR